MVTKAEYLGVLTHGALYNGEKDWPEGYSELRASGKHTNTAAGETISQYSLSPHKLYTLYVDANVTVPEHGFVVINIIPTGGMRSADGTMFVVLTSVPWGGEAYRFVEDFLAGLSMGGKVSWGHPTLYGVEYEVDRPYDEDDVASFLVSVSSYVVVPDDDDFTVKGVDAAPYSLLIKTGDGYRTRPKGDNGPVERIGSAKEDTLEVGPSGGKLFGLGGNDVLRGGPGKDELYGGAGADTLHGGSGRDELYGGAGADLLRGDAGKDILAGGAGADELHGGVGNDILRGGKGMDFLVGGPGADYIDGGPDADAISYHTSKSGVSINMRSGVHRGGDAEGDTLVSAGLIIGSNHNDRLVGDDLGVGLAGMGGSDVLVGGAGRDGLYGDAGNDRLVGGKGADFLQGWNGKDRLEGGVGPDTLEGGKGADQYVFRFVKDSSAAKKRWDVITDFKRGDGDRINLKAIDAKIGTKPNDKFTYIGGDRFSGEKGELRMVVGKKKTFVYGDVNGDARGDLKIELKGRIHLAEDDFVL